MAAGGWYVVEDETERIPAWAAWRRDLLERGRAITAPTHLNPSGAMARARAGGDPTRGWTADDVVLLDCWDRNLPEKDQADFDTVFFALDILHELRARRDRGEPVPRVVAFSRAMPDPLVRAALAEFALPLVRHRVDGGDPVHRVRVDTAATPYGPEAVLWAMFDLDALRDRLVEVLAGDRTGGLLPPPPTDPVYADFLPESCFATFHHEMRWAFPDLWRRGVLGGELVQLADDDSTRRAINRLGRRYLAVNPARGGTYQGLIQLARRIAQPPPFVPARGPQRR